MEDGGKRRRQRKNFNWNAPSPLVASPSSLLPLSAARAHSHAATALLCTPLPLTAPTTASPRCAVQLVRRLLDRRVLRRQWPRLPAERHLHPPARRRAALRLCLRRRQASGRAARRTVRPLPSFYPSSDPPLPSPTAVPPASSAMARSTSAGLCSMSTLRQASTMVPGMAAARANAQASPAPLSRARPASATAPVPTTATAAAVRQLAILPTVTAGPLPPR